MTDTRAARYRRISDDREGREAGVQRQGDDIDALAAREGLTIVADYVDNDMSASERSTKKRPGYERMLADARAGKFSVILAYTSSRLTRRPRENEDLIDLAKRHGITYRYVKSPAFDLTTADGQTIARILAAQDAGEAERAAERIKRASDERVRTGEFNGGPPAYGVASDGVNLIPEQADRVRTWADGVLAGKSLRSMATALNRGGIPTQRGGKSWEGMEIRRILLNPVTAGYRVLDGQEYAAPNPAIIDRATHDAVRAILTAPGRRPGSSAGRPLTWMGTGLYTCERCPEGSVRSGYHADGVRIYKCYSCWRTWRGELLDQWITQAVEGRLADEDAVGRLLPAPAGDGPDLAALSAEAGRIRARMGNLAAQYVTATGATEQALAAGMAAGEARLAEIAALTAQTVSTDPVDELLTGADPVAAFRALPTVEERQAVIRRLVTVVLGQPPRGRQPFTEAVLGGSRWTGDTRTWAQIWAVSSKG